MTARPSLAEEKLDALVELFSEHIKFPTSIVYSEKMDDAKIDQKRLKDKGFLLEQLQRNLSFSLVVVKIVLKRARDRTYSLRLLGSGPARCCDIMRRLCRSSAVSKGAPHIRDTFQKSAVRCWR